MSPPPPSGETDGDLVQRARSGERAAFDALIIRHGGRLLRLVRRNIDDVSEADDIVQSTFARTWLKLDRFDPSRAFEPWVTRIAINLLRDRHRHRRVRSFLTLGEHGDAVGDARHPATSASDPFVERDLLRRVEQRIARLPLKLREPFVLVTFDGRSQAEAADILGISEKAVETRIYRARALLRAEFGGSEG